MRVDSNPHVKKSPLLIAHRGESRDAPENTLASVELAWKRGAKAVEIDVRTSSDGQAMVIHDPTTRQIEGPATPIGLQTSAGLRALDAGRWKGRRWAGQQIPFLREVIATVSDGRQLFVELKEGLESVSAVMAAWKSVPHVPGERLAFMSFQRGTVEVLSGAAGAAEVLLLLEKKDWSQPRELAQAFDFASGFRLAGLNLEADSSLDEKVIGQIHERGLKAYAWTVNRVPTAERLIKAGIDGLATDRCAWMGGRLNGTVQA